MRDIDLVPESTAIGVDDHRYRLAVAVNNLILNKVEHQDDSSAATVAELVSDFNDLLQKMRDAGWM